MHAVTASSNYMTPATLLEGIEQDTELRINKVPDSSDNESLPLTVLNSSRCIYSACSW